MCVILANFASSNTTSRHFPRWVAPDSHCAPVDGESRLLAACRLSYCEENNSYTDDINNSDIRECHTSEVTDRTFLNGITGMAWVVSVPAKPCSRYIETWLVWCAIATPPIPVEMEVVKSNFHASLPIVEEAIRECAFVGEFLHALGPHQTVSTLPCP